MGIRNFRKPFAWVVVLSGVFFSQRPNLLWNQNHRKPNNPENQKNQHQTSKNINICLQNALSNPICYSSYSIDRRTRSGNLFTLNLWNSGIKKRRNQETKKPRNQECFLFSTKGIPSTPQHADSHPCTSFGLWAYNFDARLYLSAFSANE